MKLYKDLYAYILNYENAAVNYAVYSSFCIEILFSTNGVTCHGECLMKPGHQVDRTFII